MAKKVAFIVIGYNNADILPECFESIYSQSYKNVEIYFVENGNQDNSVAMIRKDFPKVKVIEPGENTGFARGNNIGIQTALEDSEVGYVALLNSDARVKKDWVEKIVSFAAKSQKARFFKELL